MVISQSFLALFLKLLVYSRMVVLSFNLIPSTSRDEVLAKLLFLEEFVYNCWQSPLYKLLLDDSVANQRRVICGQHKTPTADVSVKNFVLEFGEPPWGFGVHCFDGLFAGLTEVKIQQHEQRVVHQGLVDLIRKIITQVSHCIGGKHVIQRVIRDEF